MVNIDMRNGVKAYIAMTDAGMSRNDALDALTQNRAIGLGDTWGYHASDSVTFVDFTSDDDSGFVLCK